jgi:hypothetical protein
MRNWAAGAVAVVVAMLCACSSDTGTQSSAATSAATSSTPDVCASADEFRASLTDLKDVDVVQQGTDALTATWTTVEDSWTQLAGDARATHADQVDRVQADADAVSSAVETAQGDTSAGTVGAVAAAVGVFLKDADTLLDEVGSTC